MLPILRSVALTRALASPGRLSAVSKAPILTSILGRRTFATDLDEPSSTPSAFSRPPSPSVVPGPLSALQPSQETPFPRTSLRYHVGRTASNNLPVYEKHAPSKARAWTQIRRVDGGMDGLKQLKAELEEHLRPVVGDDVVGQTLKASASEAFTVAKNAPPPPPRVRPPRQKRNQRTSKRVEGEVDIKINPTTSHINIAGRHKNMVVSFLEQRGF